MKFGHLEGEQHNPDPKRAYHHDVFFWPLTSSSDFVPPTATPRPFLHDPSPPATLQLGPHDGTKTVAARNPPDFFWVGENQLGWLVSLGAKTNRVFGVEDDPKKFTPFCCKAFVRVVGFWLGRCFFSCSTAGIVVFFWSFWCWKVLAAFSGAFCFPQNDGVEKVVPFNYGEFWYLAAFGSVH